jgi:hypothetical protein
MPVKKKRIIEDCDQGRINPLITSTPSFLLTSIPEKEYNPIEIETIIRESAISGWMSKKSSN